MRLRGSLMLLLTAFFWGTTFVAQLVGMDGLGPYTYAMFRFALGVLCLLPLFFAYRGRRAQMRRAGTYRSGFLPGIPIGIAMFGGVTLQQVALLYTTAGKTAFISTLYIVLVPLGALLLGRRLYLANWIGAGLAFTGLYFLSAYGETALNKGDTLVILCSFFWVAQILLIDRFASTVDAIELCLMEMLICTLGSMLLSAVYETFHWADVIHAAIPILYGGILSCGVAYTLQILGQAYVEPAQASIIMSLESVFAVAASWLVLGEQMTLVQSVGCALLLIGAIVTQYRTAEKTHVQGQ